MSKTIKQIRTAVNTQFDLLEARAEAVIAQLKLAREQALRRLDQHKFKAVKTLDRLNVQLEKQKGLAAEKKAKILQAAESLKTKLQSETNRASATIQEQEKKAVDGLFQFETRFRSLLAESHQKLDQRVQSLVRELVEISNTIETEAKVTKNRFEEKIAERQSAFERQRKVLTEKLAKLKTELQAKGRSQVAKLRSCETEVSAAANRVRQALKKLFS